MKHGVFIGILVVIVIAIGSVVYLKYSSFSTEKKLVNEVNEINDLLTQKDYDKNKLNMYLNRIVSKDDYAVVESSYKEYIKDFVSNVDLASIVDRIQNNKISSSLSIENYESDGKSFEKTLKYLNDEIEFFKKTKENESEYFKKEKAYSYIDGKELSDYYVLLYKNSLIGDFEDYSEDFSSSIDDMISIIDNVKNVIVFLKNHKDDWDISNGKLEFIRENIYNEYNELIGKIKNAES